MFLRLSSSSWLFLFLTLSLLQFSAIDAFLPPIPGHSVKSSVSSLSSSSSPHSSSVFPSSLLSPSAFSSTITTTTPTLSPSRISNRHLSYQRLSPLHGIFGLGTPEIVVICVVAGVVLGPDKLVDLARGFGKAAGELKAVPQEFEKGLNEGKTDAKKEKKKLKTMKTDEGSKVENVKEKETQVEE